MSFLGVIGAIATAGFVGIVAHQNWLNAERDRQRRETPCHFDEGITENDLDEFARNAKKGIRRIRSVHAKGPSVYGTVRSQSGISEWSFELDFNDWGHITGQYWERSENSDSQIPRLIGDRIKEEIEARIESSRLGTG